MPTSDAFPAVFARLKAILTPFSASLTVQTDTPESYVLNAPVSEKHPRYTDGVLFGSVQVKKNYVSYHLLPVYVFPDLLDGIPDPLKKRMQGKSCFNFTRVDEETMAALAALTARGFARYQQEDLVP